MAAGLGSASATLMTVLVFRVGITETFSYIQRLNKLETLVENELTIRGFPNRFKKRGSNSNLVVERGMSKDNSYVEKQ